MMAELKSLNLNNKFSAINQIDKNTAITKLTSKGVKGCTGKTGTIDANKVSAELIDNFIEVANLKLKDKDITFENANSLSTLRLENLNKDNALRNLNKDDSTCSNIEKNNKSIKAEATFYLLFTDEKGELDTSLLTPAANEAKETDNTANTTKYTLTPADIKYIQSLLAVRGFYKGQLDGVLSGETKDAIVKAQNFYQISPTEPGNKLIDSLKKDVMKEIQKLLKDNNLYDGELTGTLDPKTEASITSAQKKYNVSTIPELLTKLKEGSSANGTGNKNATLSADPTLTITNAGGTALANPIQLPDEPLDDNATIANVNIENGEIQSIKGDASALAQKDPSSQNKLAILSNANVLKPSGTYKISIEIKPSAKDSKVITKVITVKTGPNYGNTAAKKADTEANTKKSLSEEEVANLQQLLKTKGFYNGPITGVIGERTKEAIIAAKKAYGFSNVNNSADAELIQALKKGAPSNSSASKTPNEKPSVVAQTNTAKPLTADSDTTKKLTITEANLNVSGKESIDKNKLIYTVSEIIGGKVFRENTELGNTATFTQQEIKDNKINFVWDEPNPKPRFSVTLTDEKNVKANTITFNVAVTPIAGLEDEQKVKQLQLLLKEKKLYNGQTEGISGEKTKAAIKAALKQYNVSTIPELVAKLQEDSQSNQQKQTKTEENTSKQNLWGERLSGVLSLKGTNNENTPVPPNQKQFQKLWASNPSTNSPRRLQDLMSLDYVSRKVKKDGASSMSIKGEATARTITKDNNKQDNFVSKLDAEGIYTQENLPTLKLGESGEKVKLLKHLLNRVFGYSYTDPANNSFDELTKAAVFKFQKNNGLVQDGIVGKNTWVALIQKLEISKQVMGAWVNAYVKDDGGKEPNKSVRAFVA